MSLIEDLDEIAAQIAVAREGLAYIVTDSTYPENLASHGHRDGRGRIYAVIHPTVLDGIKRAPQPADPMDDPFGITRLTGIPIYPRESMTEGWPDRC